MLRRGLPRIGRAEPQNEEDEVVDHHSEALRRGPERAIEYAGCTMTMVGCRSWLPRREE